jgi:hypothetical protein
MDETEWQYQRAYSRGKRSPGISPRVGGNAPSCNEQLRTGHQSILLDVFFIPLYCGKEKNKNKKEGIGKEKVPEKEKGVTETKK